MFRLKSLGSFEVGGQKAFVVESPVSAERTFAAMRDAMGNVVNIDGLEYEPVAFEMYTLTTPVQVGERISVLVRRFGVFGE